MHLVQELDLSALLASFLTRGYMLSSVYPLCNNFCLSLYDVLFELYSFFLGYYDFLVHWQLFVLDNGNVAKDLMNF